ncbi:MAG: insulinase family protein [Bacteroides sp.]
MKHSFRRLLVAALIICGANMVYAQQQMPPIPLDKNVRIGKLDNGLTYYIRHNALPANRADFYIAQKVGSILEEDNQRGLAHFLEHMCFNGTTHYPGSELKQYLEKIGVKFGENLNAYTSVDETVYNISNVPVVRDGIIDSCLLILYDWSSDLSLEDKEIDKERGVIHEEWRTRTGAMMRMYEKAFPTIYAGSKYANRLPIGTMEIVDNFPYQVLRDYYEKWYRPDQQGLVIVGDFDVEKMETKIKVLFSKIQKPNNPAERIYFPVPDNKAPIISISKDKEQPDVQIYVFNKHDITPNENKGTMDYMITNYATYIIGQMLSARLNELTQTPTPPFIYAGVYDSDFFLSKTKDAFTGIVVSKEDGIENALGSLVRETERARRFGFTASEYARARAEYLRYLESAFNERDKQKNESYVNEYVRHFIDNEPIPGIENEYAIMNQIVPNIPVEALNQMMPALVTDSNLVISIFGPDKEGLVYPSEKDIEKVVEDVKKENITAYEDKVSDEPLMTNKPKAGKIVSIKENGPFGSTVLTLSNGAKVIIKKTDFKADEINMKGVSLGGSSLMPESEIINIKTMNDVVELGGLGNFSTINLEKVLAGKKASVSAGIGTNTESISGSCSPKDLETMMQLTYLTFTAPRMDADAFKSYQSRTKSSLQNQEANPMVAFMDSIQAGIYSNHPRSLSIKANMIDKIDYQKTMDMFKDRFKDASDFTFIMVGNVDLEAAKPLIEEYIASLPSINRKETFKDTKMNMRKGIYKNEFTRKMETAKTSVLALYNGKCAYTLENEIMMSMFTQVLSMIYNEEVREKEGGTYGVSVYGRIIKHPTETFALQIIFDTDPSKKDKMIKIVLDEAEKVAAKGPSVDYVNKVKEFMLKKNAENLKENGYWLNILDDYFYSGKDMSTGYDKIVNSITPAKVQKFAKMLLNQKNQTEIIMTAEK